MTKFGIEDLGKQLFHQDDFDNIIAFAEANGAVIDEDEILDEKEWAMGSDNATQHIISDWCIDYIADNLLTDDVTLGLDNQWWFIAEPDFWEKALKEAAGG